MEKEQREQLTNVLKKTLNPVFGAALGALTYEGLQAMDLSQSAEIVQTVKDILSMSPIGTIATGAIGWTGLATVAKLISGEKNPQNVGKRTESATTDDGSFGIDA